MTLAFAKDFWGFLSLIFVVVATVPYLRSVRRGRTNPHLFSWIIWGLMTGIAAAAQVVGHAGPGAWAAIFAAIQCFVVIGFCFKSGDRDITRSDWIALAAGLGAIPLWVETRDPLPAVLWVTFIDAIGYSPTFRKFYAKPAEERTSYYAITNLKHLASLCAMTTYSMTTIFYPAVLFTMNTAFIVMLLWRRARLARA